MKLGIWVKVKNLFSMYPEMNNLSGCAQTINLLPLTQEGWVVLLGSQWPRDGSSQRNRVSSTNYDLFSYCCFVYSSRFEHLVPGLVAK